jgi:hypothetical protein
MTDDKFLTEPAQRHQLTANGSRKLHIGSGTHYADGWMNVDCDDYHKEVDLIADVFNLPFDPDSFDQVYMGHFLEHLQYGEIHAALNALRRVAPFAEYAIVGPCMDKALALNVPQALLEAIKEHDPPPGGHAWTATTDLTLASLLHAGMHAQEVPVSEVHFPKWCNVAPGQAWQCAFLAHWPDYLGPNLCCCCGWAVDTAEHTLGCELKIATFSRMD